MRYEAIPGQTDDAISSILQSKTCSDEDKAKALYSAIYNSDEVFSSKMIGYSLMPGVFESPILAARSVVAFMQSRRSALRAEEFLISLKKLSIESSDDEQEIQEIIEDVEDLMQIFQA